MPQFPCLINNQLITTSETIKITSPVDLKVFAETCSVSETQVNEAFEIAHQTFLYFQHTSDKERIILMEKWIAQLSEDKQLFVDNMVKEIGKSIKECESEFNRTIELMRWSIHEFSLLHPLTYKTSIHENTNKQVITKRYPLGVISAISPFNYPLNLAMSKIAPAILMGNCVVFKPSTQGSVIGSLLAQTYHKLKVHPNVFQVVIGKGSKIGDLLITNKHVKLINFTGSTPIGKKISQLAEMKYVILELGGKDPALVLTNHNLQNNVKNIIKGAFSYSGQRCTAIKRVLVLKEFEKELIDELWKQIKTLKVGSAYENSDIVPLIDEKAALYCQELIEDAKIKKAVINQEKPVDKNLVYPTLISNVSLDMKVAWEEPFGPILPVIACDSIEQMLKIANQSEYGLQASIYHHDFSKAIQIAEKLECGSVNINSFSQRGPDILPFLGIKNSGLGVQGIKDSLLACSYPKNIVINY